MSPHALFVRFSAAIMLIVFTVSLYIINKSSVDAWAGSTGISVGDMIGAEIGGTLGVMIRDDPPPAHNNQTVEISGNNTFRAFNAT